MHWLRSRWTVVALVPAFFLAGFAIVTALADGSDEPAPAAGPTASSTTAAPGTVTIGAETAPPATSTEPAAPTATEDGGAAPATTSDDGGGGGGGGDGGDAPPAPPPGDFVVDYGEWEGMFELENLEIQPEAGRATLFGELHYLGGLDCPVGLVRVRAWLYSGGEALVGRTQWESVDSTGVGAEVTGREPVPFEALMEVASPADAAVARFTAVSCL